MRFVLMIVLLLLALPALGQDGVTPSVDTVLTETGGFRFAGPHPRDDAPDLIELETDGEIRVTLFSGGGAPKYDGGVAVAVPFGNPTWGLFGGSVGSRRGAATAVWPDAIPVGNAYLSAVAGSARQYNIRGTGADSMHVEFIGASRVGISCSKKR